MEYYLNMFDIKDAAGDIRGSYSSEMKQKLVITSAFMNEPEWFILDEPMVGLYSKFPFNFRDTMRQMWGCTGEIRQ